MAIKPRVGAVLLSSTGTMQTIKIINGAAKIYAPVQLPAGTTVQFVADVGPKSKGSTHVLAESWPRGCPCDLEFRLGDFALATRRNLGLTATNPRLGLDPGTYGTYTFNSDAILTFDIVNFKASLDLKTLAADGMPARYYVTIVPGRKNKPASIKFNNASLRDILL